IDIIDRSTHRLQYTAYEAAGFPQGWKPTGKDPLREARAIAAIRVKNPAAFLRIKNALSLEETQSILMSLPDTDILSGIGGQPLVRYAAAAEKLPRAEAFKAAMDIVERFGLTQDIKSLFVAGEVLRARFQRASHGHPDFLDFHIRNATGWCLDLSILDQSGRYEIDEIDGERLREENPKGRLLEQEQIKVVKSVLIHVSDALPVGFQASGEVILADAFFRSAPHFSRTKKKHAEQSAAAELLNFVLSHTRGVEQKAIAMNLKQQPKPMENKVSLTPGLDARQRLNEMVQKGIFSGFEYDDHGQRGPVHEPVFFCSAKVLGGHGWISGEVCSGHTKKLAQAAAAARLLEQIIERSKRPSVQQQMKSIREQMVGQP
ncbi:MAG: putative dsRNA-binding protein, partial [Pseudobdellovibrionaceae bacterium]|nr:putative dsRNA-binding protein [Pseudobdellovibrionaceae bacterium]